eukprot:TRINITY_DN4811_c0_g1_i1.p1 TRINITY_DN4811_c0_g1~~TRINITY_DN4811_c0_g1_i1.p1  ORF type:complete len:380 (-),score=54.26 TRINITY_DN4811_c0_g1_i1:53-1192(-)
MKVGIILIGILVPLVLAECEGGSYPYKGECKKCTENCGSCDAANPGSCKVCAEGYERVHDSSKNIYNCKLKIANCESFNKNNNSLCELCSPHFLLNNEATACTECINKCLNCKNSTDNCTICDPGYYLKDSKCLPCEKRNCATCDEDGKGCSVCMTGFILEGLFGKSCKACPDNCNVCEKESKCSVCNAGYYLTDDNICKKCSSPGCQSCPKDYCNGCQAGYMMEFAAKQSKKTCTNKCAGYTDLIGSKCYIDSKCPSGSSVDKYQRCKICGSNCEDCDPDAQSTWICEECNKDYQLVMYGTDYDFYETNYGQCQKMNCTKEGKYSLGDICFLDGCPKGLTEDKNSMTCKGKIPENDGEMLKLSKAVLAMIVLFSVMLQ